jgi:mannose-6-phosphate isomerase-like protein (cupin superfamily)
MTKALVVHEEDVVPFSKDGRDFRVLLSPSKQDTKIALGTAYVHPLQSTPRHVHEDAEEAWYVMRGVGHIVVGDEIVEAQHGMVVTAPAGVPHHLENTSRMWGFECLVVFSPAGPEEAFIP